MRATFLIVVTLLPLAFLSLGYYDFHGVYSTPKIITFILSLIGLLRLTLESWLRHSVRFYIHWTRLISWIRNPLSKWSVRVSFHGSSVPVQNIREIVAELRVCHPELRNAASRPLEAAFIVNDTLFCSLTTNQLSEEILATENINDGGLVYQLVLGTIELRYRDSKEKLQSEIVPLMEEIQEFLHAKRTSYEMDVFFGEYNPFYNVFLGSLRSDTVEDFRVHLNFSQSEGKRQAVNVLKDRLEIFAPNVNSLSELAGDLLLFSPDIDRIQRR